MRRLPVLVCSLAHILEAVRERKRHDLAKALNGIAQTKESVILPMLKPQSRTEQISRSALGWTPPLI